LKGMKCGVGNVRLDFFAVPFQTVLVLLFRNDIVFMICMEYIHG